LIELSTTGDVDITVGAGGDSVAGDGGDTEIIQGSLDEIAQGGQVGAPGGVDIGGASGNGNAGDSANLGGGGAGGVAEGNNGGAGVVVNEIDPATFTLFADDDRCLGGGGAGAWAWGSASLNAVEAGCSGGYPAAPDTAIFDGNYWTWSGSTSDVELIEPVANSGGGAGALDRGTLEYTDGADGIVVLRFTATELAATGFDATASIVAGAALFAGGVAAVATRRRRSA
jgi:LPXTG-motif cell wall-anchored protein